ncbi:MAG TPA: phosphomannomutase/phosphoglucomutase [Stellaceae bacterium]|nr:phosphomannomutase/phosphoglucomutase [Stellaceae bacterium]
MADTIVGHRFDATILREYDIRGVVGDTLHEADANAIGRSFAVVLKEAGGKSIAVGRDGRLSSRAMENALVDGLRQSGIDVVRIGLGPTPMLYFAVNTLGVDAGIMVTGSHNPPSHNGFKIMLGKKPFFAGDILRLGKIAAEGKFLQGSGKVSEKYILDDYVARLLKDYDGTRDLCVAWDAGNGATGEALQKLVKTLPGKHLLLNEQIDGRFPAHHPDPTELKNLVQLQEAVTKNGCDFGVAFDGDGDRIGLVDGKGRVLWGDQFMVLMARDIVRAKPQATIIADVKASQVLFDEVERMGGTPLMWRTGHSLIKSKMAETGAPLAGEMSGHIFFADRYFGYDDALYAGVRILGILSRGKESLAQFRDSLPAVVNTPELRFPCDDERKFNVVEEVRTRLEKAGAAVSAIDGVRVKTPEGWWLLRASNTQAVLVARAEARDAAGLEVLKKLLVDQLRDSGVAPPVF